MGQASQNQAISFFLPFSQACIISFPCSLEQCLISSRAETSKKKLWPILRPNKPKWGPKLGFPGFSFFSLLLYFHISCLHGVSFTSNPSASFFRHGIVEWLWIEFKVRPMLFKKSWNFFYSNIVRHPVKLAYSCWG